MPDAHTVAGILEALLIVLINLLYLRWIRPAQWIAYHRKVMAVFGLVFLDVIAVTIYTIVIWGEV